MSMILEPRVAEARIRELEAEVARLREQAVLQNDTIDNLQGEVTRLRAGWDKSDILLGEEMDRAEKAKAEVARLRELLNTIFDAPKSKQQEAILRALHAISDRAALAAEKTLQPPGED